MIKTFHINDEDLRCILARVTRFAFHLLSCNLPQNFFVHFNRMFSFQKNKYSRTLVTRTLKGNEKQFELAGNSSYQGEFQWNFDEGRGNLVRVRGNLSYLGSAVTLLLQENAEIQCKEKTKLLLFKATRN